MGRGNFGSLTNDDYIKGRLPTLVLEQQKSYRILMRNQTQFMKKSKLLS